ncbi:MAG: TRAFAC class dynamin-like GTPase superfamily, partial [Paramarteilia canceri]
MNIGPQPTTDGFDVYAFGETGTTLQGNIALSSAKYPFQPFIRYGDAFINKFRIHELPNDTLKGTVIIDTPGILSGAKQLERGYPFDKVICDLAE